MANLKSSKPKLSDRAQMAGVEYSGEKVIVYAWVNDEATLRKAGAKTDHYSLFRSMLKAGDPPWTIEQLMARASELKG
jgi:toxin YhaV